MSEHKLSSETMLPRLLDYLRREYSFAWAILSADLCVLEVSERFRAFQADASLEPVGSHVTELFWELVGGEPALQDVLEGREPSFQLENINRQAASGSACYVAIKAVPLVESEPGRGLLLIVQDTTSASLLEQELVQDRNELRLARNRLALANEELRRLNRLKSLFLSIAAHDLRAPLTAMLGYAELASQRLPEGTDGEAGEYLSIIASLVDSLNRLICDFLDLDIIEQGNLKIRPVACDLNAIVLDVAEVMRTVARPKAVLIETSLQADLPPLYADPDRVRQILFNLIGNAVKYTNEQDAVIVETGADTDCLLLSVSDHGPGIPAAEIPWLFDLYHRTEEARQSKSKGLGLGLFIVKSLVDLHGGKIFTRSEPGKGTQFTVRLPVYQAEFGGKL